MFAVVFLFASSPVGADPTADAEKARKELQGSWRLVSAEEKGEKIPAEAVQKKKQVLKIEGNTIIVYDKNGEDSRLTFTVDPAKTPAHIEFKRMGREGTCHAIYSVDKGQLRICFGGNFMNPNKPENRPQEFATAKGSAGKSPKGELLFVLEREK